MTLGSAQSRLCIGVSVGVVGMLLACACARAADDAATVTPIEAYLQRLELRSLLAVEIEEQLEAAPIAGKPLLAERLARLYVELLASASGPLERSGYEAKARKLLRQLPDVNTLELRVELARALYNRAEELVEKSRLRVATAKEDEEGESSMRALALEFSDIGLRATRRVDQLAKLENSGETSEKNAQELADARRVRSQAYFLAGWCNTYLALIKSSDTHANEAMRDFGVLLNAPSNRPATLDRLPKDLLEYEHIARAVIGCALASSVRGNDIEAVRWLDALDESELVTKAVRDQVPARRITILAAARRWADLEFVIRRLRKSDPTQGPKAAPTPLSPPLARLLAIVTLEADRKGAKDILEKLAKTALSDLVVQKQANQVLDLVSRYGTAALGDTGFIVHFVRGMEEYQRARSAHTAAPGDSAEPSTDPAIVNQYRAATRLLEAAIAQTDAKEFTGESARAGVTRGLALFYAGDFSPAGEQFESAWKALSLGAGGGGTGEKPIEGEETLWLAVIAWNHAADANTKSTQSAARRDQAAALYLKNYPESPNAPKLVLLQATKGGLSDEEAIKALLAVPSDSPVYDAARRQVSRMYFNRLRQTAPGSSRREVAAIQYLGIAEELFGADLKIALDPEGKDRVAAGERAVARGRQMLDALLSMQSPDVKRAGEVLASVRGVIFAASLDESPVRSELAYREVQIALAQDNVADAILIADRSAQSPVRGDTFAAASDRLICRRLSNLWAATGEGRSAENAERLVRVGLRVIDRSSSDAAALREPALLALHATLASAASELHTQRSDPAMRDLAIRLDTFVLSVEPLEEQSLRRLGTNSEAAGNDVVAIDCWRVLAEALPTGSPPWFEARFNTLRLLAKKDPQRVRDALIQLRSLYPDFGPEPWGPRLLDLELTLPQAPLPAPLPAGTVPSGGPGATGGGGSTP